jgi:hypothetical protein
MNSYLLVEILQGLPIWLIKSGSPHPLCTVGHGLYIMNPCTRSSLCFTNGEAGARGPNESGELKSWWFCLKCPANYSPPKMISPEFLGTTALPFMKECHPFMGSLWHRQSTRATQRTGVLLPSYPRFCFSDLSNWGALPDLQWACWLERNDRNMYAGCFFKSSLHFNSHFWGSCFFLFFSFELVFIFLNKSGLLHFPLV